MPGPRAVGREWPGRGWYDVVDVWRDWAGDVTGEALDCGHYLPEEAPAATLAALPPFLARVAG